MFSFERSNPIDIGARNVAAAQDALAAAGVPVYASATGGSSGRSVRIRAADGVVRVREACRDGELYRPAPIDHKEGESQ
jgi:chemotaxis protein CheD